jgi:hypothetical protein
MSRPPAPMPEEIRAFFDSYCAAFNALDGEAVARLYAVPSGIASDTGYVLWQSYELIRENMVALCRLYEDNGYVRATFAPAWFLGQGEQYAVADLRWHIERANGADAWEFNTTYNLMRTSDGWRVLLCTAYSETPLDR